METLKSEGNYLSLSDVHIGLKPMTIFVNLQERTNDKTKTKSKHDNFLKVAQVFYKTSIVYVSQIL